MANKEKKVKYKGKMVKSIDITPTWESLLPFYFDQLDHGNDKSKDLVKGEITRMAQALDKFNAMLKNGTPYL